MDNKIPSDVTAIKTGTYPITATQQLMWGMGYGPLLVAQLFLTYYFCHKLEQHLALDTTYVIAIILAIIIITADILIALGKFYNPQRFQKHGKIGVYVSTLPLLLGLIGLFI